VKDNRMTHDQNFKNLVLDYPRQALAFFAPDEAQDIYDNATIVPIRQEQLKERLGDRFRELDVPLLVEWPDGRREALLFVVEEETEPRRFSIHRLAHYCLDLAELLQTDRVVPVVIFLHGGKAQRTLELGGDRHCYLNFHYLFQVLEQLPVDSFLESDNIVARLNLPNMRYPPEQRVDIYASAMQGLMKLEQDPEKRLKYIDFVDIYCVLDDNERTHYQNKYPEEAKAMSTFAERFIDQGMQQGMQQGEAQLLLHQLQHKFGALPDQTRTRIESADSETLLEWSMRILTAATIDEVIH